MKKSDWKTIVCPKCKRTVRIYKNHTLCKDCFYVYVALNQYRPPDISDNSDSSERLPENPYDGMGFYEYGKKIKDKEGEQ